MKIFLERLQMRGANGEKTGAQAGKGEKYGLAHEIFSRNPCKILRFLVYCKMIH